MAWPRHIWKSIWFTLRRSGKDARARNAILAVLLFLVVAAAQAARVFFVMGGGDAVPHDRWSLALYAVVAVTGGIAFLILRAVRRREDAAPLSIRPAPLVPAAGSSTETRRHLEDRLFIVASLLLRAAGEHWLRRNPVPEGAEIVTRQRHNRVLRERGLWEKLEPRERDLVSRADGEWTDDQIHEAVQWSEQLRLLRWVLRLDAEILPIEHFPQPDGALAQRTLECESLPERAMLGAWEVRPEREVALQYAARCYAELKARGLVAGGEGEEWTYVFRAECLGDSTDLLVGARTVADLDDGELRLLTAMAIARERYAAWLVDVLGSDQITPPGR